MADAVHTFGQHMHQESPYELGRRQRHGGVSARSFDAIILDLEGDAARCQWAPKFPQKWAFKIPLFGGCGMRSVISRWIDRRVALLVVVRVVSRRALDWRTYWSAGFRERERRAGAYGSWIPRSG